MSKELSVDFHNGAHYDYHSIKREIGNKFKGQFECLGENTEQCKTFYFPIEKESIKRKKDGNEDIITISQKVKFINSSRFISSVISNLVKNLAEEIDEINAKFPILFFNAKVSMIKYKFLFRNKNYSNKIDEKFKKQFKNTFKFPNNSINQFILLLIKFQFILLLRFLYGCIRKFQ